MWAEAHHNTDPQTGHTEETTDRTACDKCSNSVHANCDILVHLQAACWLTDSFKTDEEKRKQLRNITDSTKNN